MNIEISYSKYNRCPKCNLIYKKDIEHPDKDCRKNQMENYIKKRIRAGIIKGMFYSLTVLLLLTSLISVGAFFQSFSRIVKLNEELTKTNEIDKIILNSMAEAFDRIRK